MASTRATPPPTPADLSDRVAEGSPPRRILRRFDELRRRARPTSWRCSSRICAAAESPACRPTSTPAARHFTVEDGSEGNCVRYALGALKGVGEKAMESLVEERGRNGAVQVTRRFRRAHRPAPAQPPAAGEPRRRRRLRCAQCRPRRRVRSRRDDPRPRRQRARTTRDRPGRPVRRSAAEAGADPAAARRIMVAGPAHGRRAGCVRLLFLGASGRRPEASARRPQGARPSPNSPSLSIPEGERIAANMAALVEDARWRTSARGPPLPDGNPQRLVGPVRRDRV